MEQNQKPIKPSEPGNDTEPGLKKDYRPGGHRSDIHNPDQAVEENPGQANPAHNTPGHIRKDEPGQHDKGHPGQARTQSYPGIKGPDARALEEDDPTDKDPQPGRN